MTNGLFQWKISFTCLKAKSFWSIWRPLSWFFFPENYHKWEKAKRYKKKHQKKLMFQIKKSSNSKKKSFSRRNLLRTPLLIYSINLWCAQSSPWKMINSNNNIGIYLQNFNQNYRMKTSHKFMIQLNKR